MAFGIVGLGGDQDATGAATVVKSAVSAPLGSVILVCINEDNPTMGFVSDGVNAYTAIDPISYNGGTSIGTVFYSWNSTALSFGSITYTKANPLKAAALTTLYVSGARTLTNPIEATNVGAAFGTGNTPSVSTIGLSELTAEAYFAVIFGAFVTFISQDPNNAWASPPATQSTGSGSITLGGGCFVNPTRSILTYAPVCSGVGNWGAMIVPVLPPKPTSILLPQAHM